jgi:putative ABC transport system permease protein
VGLANIAAWPAAYFFMNKWLQNFAYRINLGIGIFLVSSILTLSIAVFTVSVQSIRTALSNPVNSLRYE